MLVDIARLKADNRRLMEDIKKAVRNAADAAAQHAMSNLILAPPYKVRSGRLLRNTKYRVTGRNTVTVTFRANTPYASYIELGTKPHIIKARSGKRLKFFWEKVGKTVYPLAVHHPGTKATHFLRITRNQAAVYFQEELAKRLPKR